MSDYRTAARAAGAVSIHAILDDFAQEDGPSHFSDGQSVTIAGIVTSSKTRTTKNNTLMAYVMVEDELSGMELLCFNRVIEQCGSYMQVNMPVLVRGKLSVRDEKPPQLMCDSIEPLRKRETGGDAVEEPVELPISTGAVTVYLKVPSADCPAYRQIDRVMTMFEGEDTVKIRVADTGRLLGGKCCAHEAFLQECRLWLGEENVVVKRK